MVWLAGLVTQHPVGDGQGLATQLKRMLLLFVGGPWFTYYPTERTKCLLKKAEKFFTHQFFVANF